jgi:hypothetical protein
MDSAEGRLGSGEVDQVQVDKSVALPSAEEDVGRWILRPAFLAAQSTPGAFRFCLGGLSLSPRQTGWLIGTRRWVIAIHASRLAPAVPTAERSIASDMNQSAGLRAANVT